MEFAQSICKEIFTKKYMINGEKDEEEVFRGVAKEIASVEKEKERWEEEFFNILNSGELIPGGRILANARPNGKMKSYINCYTIDINDSMEEIYESIKEDALISKTGGGVGFNISKLRPRGDTISKGGDSSGPISFLHIFNESAKVIHTGGNRRAAHLAILNISHPDIEEFITVKQGDINKKLTQFNISVEITDKFIQAVKDDKDWNLEYNGKIYKTVKAKYLYEFLTKNAYEHNEPGIFNSDIVNKYNNAYYALSICAANPCGETSMPPYSVCDLASLNLTKFIKNPFKSNASFDYEKFSKCIFVGIRFLDNVLDITKYPLNKIEDMSKDWRRIGLGFTGLGDIFVMLNCKYGDSNSKIISQKIAETIRNNSYDASCELAKEKKSFKKCNIEKILESNFIKKLPEELRNKIKQNGLRNIALNCIAPTGTTSLSVGQNCSSGIEPIFALEYERTIRTDNNDKTKKELVRDYAWQIFNSIKKDLSKDEQELIISNFITTIDITPKDSIDIQSIFQEYIDSSISKTCNLPKGFTYEQYQELILYAYEKELKGWTSFNSNGSMKGILETKETIKANSDANRPKEIIESHAPKRPEALTCHIHHCTIKGSKWIFLVGLLNNKPYELLGGKEEFINIPKKYVKGTDTKNAWIVKEKTPKSHYNLVVGSLDKTNEEYQKFENIASIFPVEMGTPTRLISALLRHGMRIEDIIEQLKKVPQEDSMFTFEFGIRRVLKYYIQDGVEAKDICPECKGKMVFENGCAKCISCGYSKCG
jgi:ribonucleoside-diphosphate reductase alpha chain